MDQKKPTVFPANPNILGLISHAKLVAQMDSIEPIKIAQSAMLNAKLASGLATQIAPHAVFSISMKESAWKGVQKAIKRKTANALDASLHLIKPTASLQSQNVESE